MKKYSEAIVDWFVSCEVIEETDRELYSYAIKSFFLSFFPIILAALLGLFRGCIDRGIIIVMPFMMIRKYSGGYHAKKLRSCLLLSSLLLLSCIEISRHCEHGWTLVFYAIISAISLITFSPIDNENRPLDQEDFMHYKKVILIIVLLMGLSAGVLAVVKLYTYAACICIGIMLSAGLQVPCIFKQIVEKVKSKYKMRLAQKG